MYLNRRSIGVKSVELSGLSTLADAAMRRVCKKKKWGKEKEKDPQGQPRLDEVSASNITRFLLIYSPAIANVSAPSDVYGYFEPAISRNCLLACFIIWSRKWFRGELNIAQARKMIVARKVSIPAVAMCRGTMYGLYLAPVSLWISKLS